MAERENRAAEREDGVAEREDGVAERERGSGGADRQESRMLTDAGMLRALTHPARLAITEHLGGTGAAATATELAEIVGLSPSATSYHLRAMAKWGLVQEAEGGGDGRERRWRAAGRGFSWSVEGDRPDPEQVAAGSALVALLLARSDERIRRWFARAADESAEWSEAVAIANAQLLVTSEEMAEINARYEELVRPYVRRNRPDPPAGARVFWVSYRAVPSEPADSPEQPPG